jgi:hypothetical protein
MASFPSTLPNPLIKGFRDTPPNLTIRTSMDQGPAKVRKRFTAGVRQVSVSFILTETQVATLETFFVTTTNGGADVFTMENPRTDATEDFRFKSPPTYSQLSYNAYNVTLELEQMP